MKTAGKIKGRRESPGRRGPRRLTRPRALGFRFLPAALLAACLGCGLFASPPKPYKPPLLATRQIVFYLDRKFNQNQALPIDLAFITTKEKDQQVLSVGAEAWFQAHKREKWPHKQSLTARPGLQRYIVVELKPPAETQSVVVVADYIELVDVSGQTVVFDAKSQKREAVFVTQKGIFR